MELPPRETQVGPTGSGDSNQVSRFIIEGRGTGFRNIAKETTARDVRSTTFAILGGLRFDYY